jgi:hypothetical protein
MSADREGEALGVEEAGEGRSGVAVGDGRGLGEAIPVGRAFGAGAADP